mmetsp:Transcript_59328/g.193517  ORF Transcript_59328/g.193517 Transcript_59328/m.193517 type:complete len:219 (-) Transcript_59328:485-1141(-)
MASPAASLVPWAMQKVSHAFEAATTLLESSLSSSKVCMLMSAPSSAWPTSDAPSPPSPPVSLKLVERALRRGERPSFVRGDSWREPGGLPGPIPMPPCKLFRRGGGGGPVLSMVCSPLGLNWRLIPSRPSSCMLRTPFLPRGLVKGEFAVGTSVTKSLVSAWPPSSALQVPMQSSCIFIATFVFPSCAIDAASVASRPAYCSKAAAPPGCCFCHSVTS